MLKHLLKLMHAPKPQWTTVNRGELSVGMDGKIQGVTVTFYPSPSDVPVADIGYKTIHDTLLFGFRYESMDREDGKHTENKFGKFIVGVHSNHIMEVIFHSRKTMEEWLKLEFRPQSNHAMVATLIRKKITEINLD